MYNYEKKFGLTATNLKCKLIWPVITVENSLYCYLKCPKNFVPFYHCNWTSPT